MATIAARAGVSTANLYRYHRSKQDLFLAVVPESVVEAHRELLIRRVHQLGDAAPAEELLRFWIAHRLQVVVVLDRAAGSPHASERERFVDLLMQLGQDGIEAAAPGVMTREDRLVLRVIFDNTRRVIVAMLERCDDERSLRAAVEAFWSYQLAGLDGFVSRIVSRSSE